MRRIYSFLSLFFLTGSLLAQDAKPTELEGSLSDSGGTPILYAHIYNMQQGQGTTTGDLGIFRLSAKAGDSLRLSYIGYETRFVVVSEVDIRNGMQVILQENTLLLREIVVRAKIIPSMLARVKPQPMQIDGLPVLTDKTPIRPGDARWGNELWKTAPIQTLGPSATINGPISYFTKEAKEQRKYQKALSRDESEVIYNSLMGNPETAAMLQDKFAISRTCCDSLLLSFNQQHPETARLKTEYQILERIISFFKRNLGID